MSKKKIEYKSKAMFKEATNFHTLWHGFQKYLGKQFYELSTRITTTLPFRTTKRKYKQFDPKKLVGYKALLRAEKYAKGHKDILVVSCDDDWFASSSIFLTPHETKNDFMGVSFVFIPQCTDTQNILFLYPGHITELIKALKILQEKARTKKEKK